MGAKPLAVIGTEALCLQAFPISASAWFVRFQGDLDASNVRLLEKAIAQIYARGVWRVAVDLGDVPYMSSGAFGYLLASADRARRNGGVMVMVRVAAPIREVFDLLGVSEYVVFADDFIAARTLLGHSAPTDQA
jgi:anti-anti-sigma factor